MDHRDLVREMAYQFGAHRRTFGGYQGREFRLRLVPQVYRKPDLANWAAARPAGSETIPMLAVEVRSRSKTMATQREKCRMYQARIALVCWLVDPVRRVVEVFEGERGALLLREGDVLSTDAMPGFTFPLAELFAVLDR